ncbi:hypothetical protein [Mesomycoplasma ovipneumoniae]|uniref:hypothetical protein n=1 Tax=Mesomycoplasma ovipneumoniae TaxID=29562 RepID=UPI002963D6A9|nr:hypothetical protein [Mesomycoplasma ovipneumoniae]MDW2929937.1 hypothetical protein [Mesomycoplasma ovipneumoniae]
MTILEFLGLFLFSFTEKATLFELKLGIKSLISSRNLSFSLAFSVAFSVEFEVNQELNCSRFKLWGFWAKYSDTLSLFCARCLEIAELNL